MRRATWGLLLLAWACSNDDKNEPDASPPDAPLVIIDAPPVPDATIRDARVTDAIARDAAAIDARPADASTGATPVIRTVVVTHASGCSAGVSTQVTVEIVATDVETQPDDLIYSGTSGSCGAITGRVSTLTCPEAAPYSYTVTVRDEDGNTAMRSFTINVCSNTPDAGPP